MNQDSNNEPHESGCARSHIETARELVPQRVVDWSRLATTWIAENPELSLGLALALGVGVGLAVKRR